MSKPLHFTERETEDQRSDRPRTPIYGRTGTSISIPDSWSEALFSQQQYTQGPSFSPPEPWSCGRAGDRYGGFTPSCFLRFSGPSASAREAYLQCLLPVSRDSWVLVPANPREFLPGASGLISSFRLWDRSGRASRTFASHHSAQSLPDSAEVSGISPLCADQVSDGH